ncbi:unnamed protein product [Trichogramma brassicae]|uniref:RING-type domain-containing protein n=1 Tax=Trichogramma brassicae TaxID=86971 RepID=A0A6H5J2Y0_9HYME|nr:unnamed protein product [Trichogramma brassicae]
MDMFNLTKLKSALKRQLSLPIIQNHPRQHRSNNNNNNNNDDSPEESNKILSTTSEQAIVVVRSDKTRCSSRRRRKSSSSRPTLGVLEEIILCPLCKRKLRSPRTLACQHSFCKKCLDLELTSSPKAAPSCPSCHTPLADFVSTDLLPVNAGVAKLLEAVDREDFVEQRRLDADDDDDTEVDGTRRGERRHSLVVNFRQLMMTSQPQQQQRQSTIMTRPTMMQRTRERKISAQSSITIRCCNCRAPYCDAQDACRHCNQIRTEKCRDAVLEDFDKKLAELERDKARRLRLIDESRERSELALEQIRGQVESSRRQLMNRCDSCEDGSEKFESVSSDRSKKLSGERNTHTQCIHIHGRTSGLDRPLYSRCVALCREYIPIYGHIPGMKRLLYVSSIQSNGGETNFVAPLLTMKTLFAAPMIGAAHTSYKIELLLVDAVDCFRPDNRLPGWTFVHFLVRCGYVADEPVESSRVERRNGCATVRPLLRRVTPLHRLFKLCERYRGNRRYRDYVDEFCLWLLKIYARYEVDYVDETTGLTHFHLACCCRLANLVGIVKRFLGLGQDPNRVVKETGYSPLHLALQRNNGEAVLSLLRAGAIRTWPRGTGTHLCTISAEKRSPPIATTTRRCCSRSCYGSTSDGRSGLTPRTRGDAAEFLLRLGADPNLASRDGNTPLHVMSSSYGPGAALAETFFRVCDESNRLVRVDAQNRMGDTPFHRALLRNEELAALLLRRGANPNFVDDEFGSTPLHVICMRDRRDKSARMLFKICHESNQPLRINARDKQGRTPLQVAVANLLPDTVEVLLDHGADLPNGLFPTSIDSSIFRPYALIGAMKAVCGALAVAEHLEARGYDFSRNDALTIMKCFAENGLFKRPAIFQKRWYDDEEFARTAKVTTIVPSLSLYDLLQLRSGEEERRLTYQDYFRFAISKNFRWLADNDACILHLCDKLSRGFFRRWALDPFYELIHNRLPLECCEMILETLNNQDLYNIWLAAAGQISRKSIVFSWMRSTAYPKIGNEHEVCGGRQSLGGGRGNWN